jgi:ActR/RegA family two-component response regulator
LAEPVRVLWVDPDILSVIGYAVLLERRGWIVDLAQSFDYALQLLGRATYDIAILELRLPDAIGSDAWYEIHQVHPLMQGIITTRSSSLRAYVNPLGPGILAYLLHPLDIDSFAAIIHQSLGRQNVSPQSFQARLPVELENWWPGRYGESMGLEFAQIYKVINTRFDIILTQLQLVWQRIRLWRSVQVHPRFYPAPIGAALLVVLVLFFGSMGAVAAAAQNALPGDILYPVKTEVETAQLAVSADAASKAQLHLVFANHRVTEVRGLVAQGRSDPVAQTLSAFEQQVKQATSELEQAARDNPTRAADLVFKADEALAQDERILTALRDTAPVAAREDLEGAIRLSETSIAVVEQQAIPPALAPLALVTDTGTPTPPGLTYTPTETTTFEQTETPAADATETLQPSDTAQPTDTPEAPGTPEWTNTPQRAETRQPTFTSEPTETPEPTDTSQPNNTPQPSQTPKPAQTSPRPSPPPPTRKPTHTPKSSHAAKAFRATSPQNAGEPAYLANDMDLGQDPGRPIAPSILLDGFHRLGGFVITQIEKVLSYFRALLSLP